MPENPSPLPPDDPCFRMVATYHDYVGARIDAFMHADIHQKFAAHFEPWQQCCGELRPKVASLRPADPNPDALRTFSIPKAVFDYQSECAQHPYFQKPTDGGYSPADTWFKEQEKSRGEFWLQQYADLGTELHGCCVRHLGPCLFKGAEARSCIEQLLPGQPPPAAVRRPSRRRRRPLSPSPAPHLLPGRRRRRGLSGRRTST